MAYSDKVIDHYEHPRNVGAFEKGDPSVGTGMVGAPACGDVMKLQIKVNEQGIIEDAKFKTYGCGSAIAEELALPPVKIHCSILAEDAIKAAIDDYKAKHGGVEQAAAAKAA
jgi:nitrogen fixation NifU-like protein